MRKTIIAVAASAALAVTALAAPAFAQSREGTPDSKLASHPGYTYAYGYTVYPSGSYAYTTYPNATYGYTTYAAPAGPSYPAPPAIPQVGQATTTTYYGPGGTTTTYTAAPVYTPPPAVITPYHAPAPIVYARPLRCNWYDVERPGVTTGCY